MGNRNIDKADEGLGGFHNAREGDTRITVPIPSAFLTTDDGYLLEYPFRMVLAPGYEIALLDEKEEERLSDGPYKIFAGFRLEIFGEASSDGLDFEDDQEHARLEEIITNALSLLSLCVRGYFSAPYAVVDRYDGNVWRRNEYIKTQGASYDLRASHVPVSRLETWSNLIRHWPREPDDVLTLALRYYSESLLDRNQGNYGRAMVSAAIATEILFGERGGELTLRISTRAAHLIERGARAFKVQKVIKELYKERSSVVHTGRGGNKDSIDIWHQFLMRAIPSVAAWGGPVGQLQAALDEASFRRRDSLDELLDEDGWWNFCDYFTCLKDSKYW